MMSPGPAAVVLGILVTVIPFSFLLRLLREMPRALVLSHRRWPLLLNCVLIAAVTACTVVFFDRAYDRQGAIERTAFEFVIASAIYGFGLALLLRQFCGVYEDFIITVAAGGLAIRKTSYTNIVKADNVGGGGGEMKIRIETARGHMLSLILPRSRVEPFYTQVRKKHMGE